MGGLFFFKVPTIYRVVFDYMTMGSAKKSVKAWDIIPDFTL